MLKDNKNNWYFINPIGEIIDVVTERILERWEVRFYPSNNVIVWGWQWFLLIWDSTVISSQPSFEKFAAVFKERN